MPYNSFQKLSNSKLSGKETLLPPAPTIVSGASGLRTRVGYRRARFGLGVSDSRTNFSKVRIYRSTDGGANYSFISGWNLSVSGGGGIEVIDIGLATGVNYTYKFGFSGFNEGINYETQSTGFNITTKVHIEATGGDYKIADASSYLSNNLFGHAQYHVFRKSANFTLQCTGNPDEKIHFLLVGGGGGGGKSYGGGGGGGGLSHITGIRLTTATNYSVTVGAGGAENAGGGIGNGNRGGSSSFLNYTGYGGGGGGGYGNPGLSGGAGGGAGAGNMTGGSGFSGANVTGLVYGPSSQSTTGAWRNYYDHQGRKGMPNLNYASYLIGGGGASFAYGDLGYPANSLTNPEGQQGWPTDYFNGGNTYSHPTGGSTIPQYGWVAVALSGNGNYISPGGGGGGEGGYGGGGLHGGGSGAYDYGEDYYSYPAGLGGSGTWYGAGGGGGGRGGGGGGAGYSGLVIVGYFTGDNLI